MAYVSGCFLVTEHHCHSYFNFVADLSCRRLVVDGGILDGKGYWSGTQIPIFDLGQVLLDDLSDSRLAEVEVFKGPYEEDSSSGRLGRVLRGGFLVGVGLAVVVAAVIVVVAAVVAAVLADLDAGALAGRAPGTAAGVMVIRVGTISSDLAFVLPVVVPSLAAVLLLLSISGHFRSVTV